MALVPPLRHAYLISALSAEIPSFSLPRAHQGGLSPPLPFLSFIGATNAHNLRTPQTEIAAGGRPERKTPNPENPFASGAYQSLS
jgi:hypothetical protein